MQCNLYCLFHDILFFEIVTCPKLPSPDYGDVEITGAYPKNTATFSCKSGYVLEGPKVLVCLYNGKWNDDPPTCERENYTINNTC